MTGQAGLRILLMNWSLAGRGGTESMIRDVAIGLRARDHSPLVYSPSPGPIAREIEAAGIPVVDDLSRLGDEPDVIHAQHFFTTGEALIRFPRTPAIHVCHGWSPIQERPPRFPQIHRYVAVSDCTRDNVVNREGIAPERTLILPNAIDLKRVPERPTPLPARIRRALAFTSSGHAAILPVLRGACEARGIEFVAFGLDRDEPMPEKTLVNFDLVFATGRSAIEALCAGCAVITCDLNGVGGLVTPDTYEVFRRHNFALRSLTSPVTPRVVEAALDRYDKASAEAIHKRIRNDADLEMYLDRLIAIYRAAIEDQRTNPPREGDIRAAVQRFLHDALPRVPGNPGWHHDWTSDPRDPRPDVTARYDAELMAMESTLAVTQSALAVTQSALAVTQSALAVTQSALSAKREAHHAALDAILASTSWRLTAPLRRVSRAMGSGHDDLAALRPDTLRPGSAQETKKGAAEAAPPSLFRR